MAIDIFTTEEFENALPRDKSTNEPLWIKLGCISGEYSYLIPIDDKVSIMVRSSISKSGTSADTGDDSIRAWLVTYETIEKITGVVYRNFKPLGSKVSEYTTRVPGWGKRLVSNENSVVRTLWRWRKKAGDCKHCGTPQGVYKVKKNNQNKGRLFTKCNHPACAMRSKTFEWLTEVK